MTNTSPSSGISQAAEATAFLDTQLSNPGVSHNLQLETRQCFWATQDLIHRDQFAAVSCHLAVLFKDIIKRIPENKPWL